jgi:hypothetical protein
MSDDVDDAETMIAFAGDWHGNGVWAAQTLARLHHEYPQVRTVLHAGDFGIMPGLVSAGYMDAVDAASEENQIDRILVTPGNHENWTALHARFIENQGSAIRWTPRVWVLPRSYRFRIGSRTFLSFGGAASVDYEFRVRGVDWWPAEIPDRINVDDAISGGPVDVMVSHETINGGTPKVELMLAANPQGWSVEALGYSAMSRARVTTVWDHVSPAVLVHGHMHLNDTITLPDGRQVISLGCDEAPGNIGVLQLDTLRWTWCAEPTGPVPS